MNQIYQINAKLKEFKEEWNKPNKNLEKCRGILQNLKANLLTLNFMPLDPGAQTNKQDLILARDILEYGVQWSLEAKDEEAFEDYISKLKTYYFDYENLLPESSFKYENLGLNLLFLLSQNRLAEFHCELERLDPKILLTNIYIYYPVMMEQYLMEGSYNSIFLSKGTVPAATYNFFVQILLDTIRNDIADCMEKAYKNISIDEAGKLLFLNSKEINDFIKMKMWNVRKDQIYFTSIDEDLYHGLKPYELVVNALGYAKELEKIV